MQTRRGIAASGPLAKLPASSSAPREKCGGFAIIDAAEGAGIAKGGTWQPSTADIYRVEANLPQVSGLKAENWPGDSDILIDHPEWYFRQYLGVIEKGKKLIYVNAFCYDAPVSSWHEKLVIILDGGTCCWQAFYDPTTNKFTSLRINGIA